MDANCKILDYVHNYLSRKKYGLGGNELHIEEIQKYYINKLGCPSIQFDLRCMKQINDNCEEKFYITRPRNSIKYLSHE